MVNKTEVHCPQCLHHNTVDAVQCSLCDWPLSAQQIDPTVVPESAATLESVDLTLPPDHMNKTKDEGLTIAPVDADPDLTIAPKVLAEQKKSVIETRTMSLAGDLAHFEILEILGQGGMGAVYHAKDRTLHRDVAIKMLRPLAATSKLNPETLLDEARMASKLNHPNIVTIYDVARAENSNYIVMEWVDGQPLNELIPNGGMPLEKVLGYACQIADGLNSAHQKYMIHRDIKPQNIMLTADDSIKILDFGIAGLVHQQSADSNKQSEALMTTPGVGTPSYMSPEQAQGLNLDQRSDIFSFGIVLYQMLSGQRPFVAKNTESVQQSICSGDYIPIQQQVSGLPVNVVKLLDKMLAVKRDDRWQNSAVLAEELHVIYAELTHSKNWWQQRHWVSKVVMLLPFVVALGWALKETVFPASTQQLIERQLAEANKIAILPFENISGDPLIQIFGDGLAVNLGSDLAAIAQEQGNTWIVPATEIARMEDPSPQQVADKYGVDLILTGSLQHLGSTRLLVLNLLHAQTGQQVKTTEIEIDANQLFQGHDLIRKQALALLDWRIPVNLISQFEQARPEIDGAYREYIQGRGYLYRYDQDDNLDKAMKAFQAALSIDPSYEKAFEGLAEVQLNKFVKTKDDDWLNEMSLVIDQLKSINPDNAQIGYLAAEIAMKRGQYTDAVALYQVSIKFNPKHVKAQIGLAKAYDQLGDKATAEQVYKSLVQSAPNNWRVISQIGIFYFYHGDYQNALNQFEQLTVMSPNNHYGFRNSAGAYYALGDIENAIKYTQLAIEIKASDVAYANLGTMLFYIKNYAAAVTAFEKAVELKNSNYLHWGNLADAYKLSNNDRSHFAYEQATQFAMESLKTNPNDAMAQATIAYYFSNMGQVDKAIQYAKAITDTNSGLEHFLVATAYDQLNEIDLSIEHLKLAIKKNYPIDEIKNTPLLKNSMSDIKFHELIDGKY